MSDVPASNITVEATESNALVVRFDDVKAGWEQWIMLSSDRHHDSPDCDREKEHQHLEKAKKRNALIVDAGDVFDVMQGKYDPRRSLDNVRDEDKGQDYLDLVVAHAAENYGPYAANWLVMGRGNHETAILSHNSTDLSARLVYRMNHEHGGRVHVGGYGGWVRFVFKINRTKSQSCNLKYFHGAGGNAPVTRGVIHTNRQAVYLPDADIVLNGHNHESYHVQVPRERLTIHGRIKRDHVDFLRTPGYKDVWRRRKGELGYEAEKGAPRLTGCAWLRFFYDGEMVGRRVFLDAG